MEKYKTTLFLYNKIFDSDEYCIGDLEAFNHNELKERISKLLGINPIGHAYLLNCVLKTFQKSSIKEYISEKDMNVELEDKLNTIIDFYKLFVNFIDDRYFNKTEIKFEDGKFVVYYYNEPKLKKFFVLMGGKSPEGYKRVELDVNNIKKDNLELLFSLIDD